MITGKTPAAKINLNDKPVQCPLCLGWMERKWVPSRKMLVLFCHFDRIAIAANDPFVGRWEEFYNKPGEKMNCPACDHEMRFFGTATGYAQFKCPKKKCATKIENSAPDRKAEPILLDAQGDEVTPAGVDRPIATPDAPGTLQ